MQKNDLLKHENEIIRILELTAERALVIDCIKRTMPKWIDITSISCYEKISEDELLDTSKLILSKSFSSEEKQFMHEYYTLIAGILPFVDDEVRRGDVIKTIAAKKNISSQTIRKYLCLYLIYQDMAAFLPKKRKKKELSSDEKNMRWALNKYFYTKHKNTLNMTYTLMLKEKYCDSEGKIVKSYPTFYQFRYFYRKYNKLQTYYISRNGLSNYQRNKRPLLGNGVREFAPNVGVGMIDSTVCDIYLVNEEGELVGRPILTACIDAYSSLCCGYSLSWEGGVYSLKNLLLNVISDKAEWCKKFGIQIQKEEWNSSLLPAVMVTDMGSEYKSEIFEQLVEIGVTIVNLPPYRPDLKGSVEKFFDVIQNLFKPHLKGKGVIECDFQERGSHDYRKDACITIKEFEKIILYCIIYYNSKRVLSNIPYTEDMLDKKIQPYANCVWEYAKGQKGANLIKITPKQIILNLMPRTVGKFSRKGLSVNKLCYKNENYMEMFLTNKCAEVAYNPDNVTTVWLIENGNYVEFDLIESRFEGKSLDSVTQLKKEQKDIINHTSLESLQAKIDLIAHIKTISDKKAKDINIKNIRSTRQKEKLKTHINHIEEGDVYE